MKLMPRNWINFQHYKNRRPPWIRLYRALLDDRQFQRLPLASRALAPMLWLLASEHDGGVFDATTDELSFRLRQSPEEISEGLQPLVNAGFFEIIEGDESDLLASCKQPATPEERRAEEIRGEEARLPDPDSTIEKVVAKKKPVPDCPHGDIIRLWGEKLPSAVQPRTWTGARADALKARWREDPGRQSLDWWAGFFEHIEKSDFLMGRTSGRDRGPFSITLDWLCEAKNFAKALDGQYDNKEPQKAAFFQGVI